MNIAAEPFVTEKDVLSSKVTPGDFHIVDIVLSDAGAGRMKAITGNMNLGRDRLAIFTYGKLQYVVTVQGQLGKHFQVRLPEDYTMEEVNGFVKRLTSK